MPRGDRPLTDTPAAPAPETAEPRLEFPAELPISAHAEEIVAAIRAHQVVVIAGETGSGKTTQLPKLCLLAGRGRIGHTQPRRIAARTVAERIAEETATSLGELVGYQVRFTRKAGRATRVKVMTDGILLAEISQDKDLRRYDTIIIDEAHERSLTIDFLLGYLKQLLRRRPDLKVIVTSATIDTERFAAHFDGAPVIHVEGRTYPVEVRYRPIRDETAEGEARPETASVDPERDQIDAITDAVKELSAEGWGDILVFLSGEREIRDTADALAAADLRFTEILPLYARLSAAEQHRVFTPHPGRRVVLATNVAETSLTVPGIRYVVDPGTARISRYSKRTKVQRLPIEPVSRASADQRKGRCGRLGPGICIRLYSEADYETRPEFTEPEILRTNLASVILQMAAADLGDIADFPFVEPPDAAQITDGIRLLTELGALAHGGSRTQPRLTDIGRRIARLPIDPRLARMLVAADELGCLKEVQAIVTGLAVPDVRERPTERREQAEALHRRFWGPMPADDGPPGESDGSDFMAVLRLWTYLKERRHALSGNGFRRLCRDEFLNFLRVREWQDLHAQVRQACDDLGMTRNDVPAAPERIHTALVTGLLSHIGLADLRDEPKGPPGKPRRRGPREYLGARGSRFAISPGSALAKTPPPLVMAMELVETSRLWARTVAAIDASWVEEVAGHLVKRSHGEPHWSSTSGAVLAYETVTLYGVPIVSGRLVNYDSFAPEEARRLFIQSALVEGHWRTRHHFVTRNAAVRREAEEVEERLRRRHLVVDDAAIFAFYDARVPSDVTSQARFDAWWRRKRHEDDGFLDLRLDDIVEASAGDVDLGAFPDTWPAAGTDLAVTYAFDPGSDKDGVAVTVPIALLNRLTPAAFTWQVPGLRHQVATELIRSLPKALRTRFVPAPNSAAAALAHLEENPVDRESTPLHLALGIALRALAGEVVEDDAWAPETLPPHLRVTFVVLDEGREVGRSKDLGELQADLASGMAATLAEAAPEVTRTGSTRWDIGDLPRELRTRRGDMEVVGFPALRDEGASVGVVVLDTPDRAAESHERGLRRLLLLTTPDPTKWVVAHLGNTAKLALGASRYANVPDLLRDARVKGTATLLARHATDPTRVRSAEAFDRLMVAVRQDAADEMRRVVDVTATVLGLARGIADRLERLPADAAIRTDVAEQLDNLVYAGFVAATRDPWFDRLPRYLRAIEVRLDAYAANPGRDRERAAPVLEVEDRFAHWCAQQPAGPLPPEADAVGWLIEELRVSVFAQALRTPEPVSVKRVNTAIDRLPR